MSTLTNSATFTVVAAPTPVQVKVKQPVLPVVSAPSGFGRLIHPTLGTVDYLHKPDEWVNIDGDILVPPTWASTKTLNGDVNVLWTGDIRDVTVEERWKQSLSMTISQLRSMLGIWMNPVDPADGYVQLWPNYSSAFGYKVIPLGLSAGGQGIVLTDLVNSKDSGGNSNGWVETPVTFTLKIVSKI